MRILMLTCHPGIQGPFPKILPLLASSLRDQGCLVETEPWARRNDQERFWEKVFRIPGDLLRVRRRLAGQRFDAFVIHTTTEWPNYSRDLPMVWLARRLVPKIVLEFHGSTPDLVLGPGRSAFKWVTRRLLASVDSVLLLSSEEQKDWRRFHSAGQFHLVTNPYESKPASAPVAERPAYLRNVPSDTPVLLYVGRIMYAKGVFDLLEALAQLHRRTPFHLVVAGAGPDKAEFETSISRLGLGNSVTLPGYLNADQLQQAYRAANLFVFPSWAEGFPTVITEAMDAGLPIVTTYLRGMADHLRDGINVRFVPPRDPAHLASAIAEVLGDASLQQRMCAANREKLKEFSPVAVARLFLSILQHVTGIDSPARVQVHTNESGKVAAA